jgi:hypothetical protein
LTTKPTVDRANWPDKHAGTDPIGYAQAYPKHLYFGETALNRLSLLTLTLATSLMALTANAYDDTGLSLGLGLVSSDLTADQIDKPFFPSLQTDSKQWMLLPSLRYQWQQFGLGVDGIRWRAKESSAVATQLTVGYPSSRLSVGGQRGWFRYGVNTAVQYTDGVAGRFGATLGPLGYERALGFEQRSDELSDKLSLGGPLLISKKWRLTVIGTLAWVQDNRAFSQQQLGIAQDLAENQYQSTEANIFAIYKLNADTQLLLSTTLQRPDSRLVQEVDSVQALNLNVFALLNYRFGPQSPN